MNKVLITGASGLLGTFLTKKFLSSGNQVIAVDINKPQIDFTQNSDVYIFEQLDLTKNENIDYLFDKYKFDLVINSFGIKGSPVRAKEKPVDFLYPSLKINTEIINKCAKSNIWLIFVSSVGVYSPSEKFIEDDVWKTLPSEHDWYPSWSKRVGELLLESYKVQYGYDNWSIIRPANIFGDYDDFSGNGTVISSTVKKIYESVDSIDCWGDGSPIRDFVYGRDVAEAIFKMYVNRIHDIVNFGSGQEITIKKMIETLVKVSGKNLTINWDTSKPNGDLRRLMDTTKQEKYDLLPQTSFEVALKRTYFYYLSQFKVDGLSFKPKELYDKGFYVGDLSEIFSNQQPAMEKVKELMSISDTKKYYHYRFDYKRSSHDEQYKGFLNESEVKEREEFVKNNNRHTIQRWWESEGSQEISNLKSFFQKAVEEYIMKIYPDLKNNMSHNDSFTLYEDGDFIEHHRDGYNEPRYCVILIYLTPEQMYNDGGGKIVIDEYGFKEEVVPIFGNFTILDFTRNNPNHEVEVVKNGFRRFTYIDFIEDKKILQKLIEKSKMI